MSYIRGTCLYRVGLVFIIWFTTTHATYIPIFRPINAATDNPLNVTRLDDFRAVMENPAAMIHGELPENGWMSTSAVSYEEYSTVTGSFMFKPYSAASYAVIPGVLDMSLAYFMNYASYGEMQRTGPGGETWYIFTSKEYTHNLSLGVRYKKHLRLGLTGRLLVSKLYPGDELTPSAEDLSFSMDAGGQLCYPFVFGGFGVQPVAGVSLSNLGPDLEYTYYPTPQNRTLAWGARVTADYCGFWGISIGYGSRFASLMGDMFADKLNEAGIEVTALSLISWYSEYAHIMNYQNDQGTYQGISVILDAKDLMKLRYRIQSGDRRYDSKEVRKIGMKGVTATGNLLLLNMRLTFNKKILGYVTLGEKQMTLEAEFGWIAE